MRKKGKTSAEPTALVMLMLLMPVLVLVLMLLMLARYSSWVRE